MFLVGADIKSIGDLGKSILKECAKSILEDKERLALHLHNNFLSPSEGLGMLHDGATLVVRTAENNSQRSKKRDRQCDTDDVQPIHALGADEEEQWKQQLRKQRQWWETSGKKMQSQRQCWRQLRQQWWKHQLELQLSQPNSLPQELPQNQSSANTMAVQEADFTKKSSKRKNFSSSASPLPALPVSREGKGTVAHSNTGSTAATASASVWIQHQDPASGYAYWCNQSTGESTWEAPKDEAHAVGSNSGIYSGIDSGVNSIAHTDQRQVGSEGQMAGQIEEEGPLNAAEIQHFIDNGYVLLRNVFSTDVARQVREKIWTRLAKDGIEKADPTTWVLRHGIAEIYPRDSRGAGGTGGADAGGSSSGKGGDKKKKKVGVGKKAAKKNGAKNGTKKGGAKGTGGRRGSNLDMLGMDPEMARIMGFDVGEAKEQEVEQEMEQEVDQEVEQEHEVEDAEQGTKEAEDVGAEAWRQPWDQVLSPRLFRAYDQLLGKGRWKRHGCGWWVVTFPGVSDPPAGASGKWHVDGAHFRHTTTAKEMGLLPIFLFNDLPKQGAGGTALSVGSHKQVARLLWEHEKHRRGGMSGGQLSWEAAKLPRMSVVDVQGRAGDVMLTHPMIVHARTKNLASNSATSVRVMCNPTVSLREEMRLPLELPPEQTAGQTVQRAAAAVGYGAGGSDGYDGYQYSPVERAIAIAVQEGGKLGLEEEAEKQDAILPSSTAESACTPAAAPSARTVLPLPRARTELPLSSQLAQAQAPFQATATQAQVSSQETEGLSEAPGLTHPRPLYACSAVPGWNCAPTKPTTTQDSSTQHSGAASGSASAEQFWFGKGARKRRKNMAMMGVDPEIAKLMGFGQ
jgi:ectoine hydroxylase-related dioxygenase (phytanoyl-CoA dioxygenase family)